MVHLMEKDWSLQDQKSLNPNSNESGRSMVEMLGTLAIIGVLSITGIAGYRYAISRYNANEVIDNITKRAVVASQQRLRGADQIDLSEMPDKIKAIYPVSGQSEANTETFSIQVQKLPQEICDIILSMDWDFPQKKTGADGATDLTECVVGENTIHFYFWNDLRREEMTAENGGPIACQDTYAHLGEVKSKKCCDKVKGTWSGDSCACGVNEYFNGTQCAPDIACQDKYAHLGEVKSKKCCDKIKGTWSGDSCACSAGDNFNGTQCAPDKCIGGKWIDGNNRNTYCVSNTEMSWYRAQTWCQTRGLKFAKVHDACNTDTYTWESGKRDCPNLTGKGSGFWWTSTPFGSNAAYFVLPSSGGIRHHLNRTFSNAALCL